jgi:23S rRNA (guanosine2251-2'-O)-methyltransferase
MEWIFGNHAVTSALESGKRKVHEVRATAQQADRYRHLCKQRGVGVSVVDKNVLDSMTKQPHQGIAAQVAPLGKVTLKEAAEGGDLLVLLDQVTDPHNVGAILRTANAMGATAVVVPSRHSAKDSPIIGKAAAGAMEYTPIIDVGNLNTAIDTLKKLDYWIVGLAGEATQTMGELRLTGKIALVMGSEGDGLRKLVRDNCDYLAKLPMVGQVESLNVSVAAGMALYEVLRQRQSAS